MKMFVVVCATSFQCDALQEAQWYRTAF